MSHIDVILQSHALMDADELEPFKDALIEIACSDSPDSAKAAPVLLRLALSPGDLDRLANHATAIADYGTRLVLTAVLSVYRSVSNKSVDEIEANVRKASYSQLYYYAIIAKYCQLPYGSPVVTELIKRVNEERHEWHTHVHTISCLSSYIAADLLLPTIQVVRDRVQGDATLTCALIVILNRLHIDQ